MIITLVTDFGTADGYAAEVKGALLLQAPGATIVDVTHDIAPGDIVAGAYVLGRAWKAFPAGTVHVAIVDPGVGTERRGIAVDAGGHWFVGPDNGLLETALALDGARVHVLRAPAGASPTFHGRDVFAPAAATLARGEAATLDNPIANAVRGARPTPQRLGGDMVGQVIHVDRFGTLITNIPAGRVAAGGSVRIGAYDLVLRSTFGDVATGELVAFIGSGGTLEIAVRDGRADAAMGQTRGSAVRVTAKAGR